MRNFPKHAGNALQNNIKKIGSRYFRNRSRHLPRRTRNPAIQMYMFRAAKRYKKASEVRSRANASRHFKVESILNFNV